MRDQWMEALVNLCRREFVRAHGSHKARGRHHAFAYAHDLSMLAAHSCTHTALTMRVFAHAHGSHMRVHVTARSCIRAAQTCTRTLARMHFTHTALVMRVFAYARYSSICARAIAHSCARTAHTIHAHTDPCDQIDCAQQDLNASTLFVWLQPNTLQDLNVEIDGMEDELRRLQQVIAAAEQFSSSS